MPQALWANPLLNDRATSLAAYLNAGHKLHLFVNNLAVTPSTPLSSFVEASFGGYAAINLAGLFGPPSFIQDGQYQISTGLLQWTCTGPPGQTIYGWWIDDGTNVKAAQLLDTAFPISTNVTYTMQLRPQEISQSILG